MYKVSWIRIKWKESYRSSPIFLISIKLFLDVSRGLGEKREGEFPLKGGGEDTPWRLDGCYDLVGSIGGWDEDVLSSSVSSSYTRCVVIPIRDNLRNVCLYFSAWAMLFYIL